MSVAGRREKQRSCKSRVDSNGLSPSSSSFFFFLFLCSFVPFVPFCIPNGLRETKRGVGRAFSGSLLSMVVMCVCMSGRNRSEDTAQLGMATGLYKNRRQTGDYIHIDSLQDGSNKVVRTDVPDNHER